MTLASAEVCAESFADVSDWTTVNFEGNDAWSSDGDVATFVCEYDAGDVYDRVWTNTGTITDVSKKSIELYFAFNESVANNYYIRIFSGADRTGDQYQKVMGSEWTSGYQTLKFPGAETGLSTIGSVDIQLRADVGEAFEVASDHLRIAPVNETGFQHDGSTVQAVTATGGSGVVTSISSDGDVLTLNATRTGAGDAFVYFTIPFDTTASASDIETSYYPFFASNFRVTDNDVVGYSVSLRLYADGKYHYESINSGYDDWSVLRFNHFAETTGTSDSWLMFHSRLDAIGESYCIEMNWSKMYSIANYTYTHDVDLTTDEYAYVENNELVIHVNNDASDKIQLDYDPAISIDGLTFNVVNVTGHDIIDWDNMYCNYYVSGVGWSGYKYEYRHAHGMTGTITTFRVMYYKSGVISAIKFIEDSTAPSVVRSSANPPDPTDDEIVTLSAVVTDTVEVYSVDFNAISTTAIGFSDVDYGATEQSDNLWTYSFAKGDLPNGYYCFLITASDGGNTNDPTEYAYVEFTVRESEIALDPIGFEGADPSEVYMQVSFVSNKAGDWSVTEWVLDDKSDAAETQTGSVSEGWNNIAWEKLTTTATIVYFNMTVTNGSLTTVVPGLYGVAQTTFYVEDRAKTETPATVTITGRITKQANYVVYDIDGNIKETDSIDALDFKISFNKWVLDTEQEIFFAIKFTNGSQSCWINWTYYAIDIDAYGQGSGGDPTAPPQWAMNIMYWNVFSAVIIGLGILGIFIKTGNIPNWRK